MAPARMPEFSSSSEIDSRFAHLQVPVASDGDIAIRVHRCLLSGRLLPGIRLLRDPLPAAYSHALQLAYPTDPSGREDNGFTEFHGDDTVGWVLPIYRRCCVSVSRFESEISDRVPFCLRRIQPFSPVQCYGSCDSSPGLTRPPGLTPHPPVAGRFRNRPRGSMPPLAQGYSVGAL